MSYTEKITVLDMLINILQEHEKTIDELIDRLEKIVEIVDQGYDKRFYIDPIPTFSHIMGDGDDESEVRS